MPHNRFWIAIASANVWRSQPFADVIGSRNKPREERVPKPISAMRQPAVTTITGVRQLSVRKGVCVVMDRFAIAALRLHSRWTAKRDLKYNAYTRVYIHVQPS